MTLQHEIHKKKPFECAEQEAYLSIVRTASVLGADFDRFFKAFSLTAASYNVLRILRSAGECGRMCHEIAEHMIAQVPDVTRLVDRLETDGLATRARCSKDRRVVYVKISDAGLERLSAMDEPVLALHRAQLGHLNAEQLRQLVDLLDAARRGAAVDVKVLLAGFGSAQSTSRAESGHARGAETESIEQLGGEQLPGGRRPSDRSSTSSRSQ
jgi:DNA-binding MarR family transcriptional regulator